jgi:glycosyltransferase involved in cell wall biosynthesis
MKHSPRISIVIPSYNKKDYIEDTLNSILSQNYFNLEIIIQDGGSTDGTVSIIKKYAKKFPNIIKWESKKDKGQVNAINKGLQRATGEVISFINADDIYLNGAFQAVVKEYIKNPHAFWYVGCGIIINEKGEEIVKLVTFFKEILLFINKYFFLLMVNYLMQPSVFISKKAYLKYGPFRGTSKFVVEYDMWLRLGKVKMPRIIKKGLSAFRISKGSITSVDNKTLLLEDEKIIKEYTNDLFLLLVHKFINLLRRFYITFV